MASRLYVHFEISTKILKHIVNQIKSHFIGIYFVRQHHCNRGTDFVCTLPAGGDWIYSHHLQVIPQSFFKVYLSTFKSLSFLKEKLIYNQVSLNLSKPIHCFQETKTRKINEETAVENKILRAQILQYETIF